MSKYEDRTTFVERTITTDCETGKSKISETSSIIKKGVEPNYIKLYISTLLTFKELPKTLNPILLSFLSYMSYSDVTKDEGGQLIFVNSYMKKEICEKLNVKINTIDKALTNFTKANIFKRIGSGTYQVNPYLFGKGEWKDISSIRAKFDFNTGDIETTILTSNNNNEL